MTNSITQALRQADQFFADAKGADAKGADAKGADAKGADAKGAGHSHHRALYEEARTVLHHVHQLWLTSRRLGDHTSTHAAMHVAHHCAGKIIALHALRANKDTTPDLVVNQDFAEALRQGVDAARRDSAQLEDPVFEHVDTLALPPLVPIP